MLSQVDRLDCSLSIHTRLVHYIGPYLQYQQMMFWWGRLVLHHCI